MDDMLVVAFRTTSGVAVFSHGPAWFDRRRLSENRVGGRRGSEGIELECYGSSAVRRCYSHASVFHDELSFRRNEGIYTKAKVASTVQSVFPIRRFPHTRIGIPACSQSVPEGPNATGFSGITSSSQLPWLFVFTNWAHCCHDSFTCQLAVTCPTLACMLRPVPQSCLIDDETTPPMPVAKFAETLIGTIPFRYN